MRSKRYPLEANGPVRLEISWGRTGFSRVKITLDGEVLVRVHRNGVAGREGKSIRLSDGAILTVKFKDMLGRKLVVLRNGVPLPGSEPPRKRRQEEDIPLRRSLGRSDRPVVFGFGMLLLLVWLFMGYVGYFTTAAPKCLGVEMMPGDECGYTEIIPSGAPLYDVNYTYDDAASRANEVQWIDRVTMIPLAYLVVLALFWAIRNPPAIWTLKKEAQEKARRRRSRLKQLTWLSLLMFAGGLIVLFALGVNADVKLALVRLRCRNQAAW